MELKQMKQLLITNSIMGFQKNHWNSNQLVALFVHLLYFQVLISDSWYLKFNSWNQDYASNTHSDCRIYHRIEVNETTIGHNYHRGFKKKKNHWNLNRSVGLVYTPFIFSKFDSCFDITSLTPDIKTTSKRLEDWQRWLREREREL